MFLPPRRLPQSVLCHDFSGLVQKIQAWGIELTPSNTKRGEANHLDVDTVVKELVPMCYLIRAYRED
jgi:hypothetical protein